MAIAMCSCAQQRCLFLYTSSPSLIGSIVALFALLNLYQVTRIGDDGASSSDSGGEWVPVITTNMATNSFIAEDELVQRYNISTVHYKFRRREARTILFSNAGADVGAREVVSDPARLRRNMIKLYEREHPNVYPRLAITMYAPWSAEHTRAACSNTSIGNAATSLAMQGFRELAIPPQYSNAIVGTRILCGVYSHADNHYRLSALIDTWGWRCDGFWVASTTPDRTYNAVNLKHAGPEQYRNMWQKTRSMLAYVHDHFIDDYDFFYFCGDDTYVVMERLKEYLAAMTTRYPAQPLILGQEMFKDNYTYTGGGPGYALNRVAVKLLVRRILPHCFVDVQTSMEDVLLSRCLELAVNITAPDSVDHAGRQRFHSMPMHRVVLNTTHQRFRRHWNTKYGVKTGLELISPSSIAFHMRRSANSVQEMELHHAMAYRLCPPDTVLGQALMTQ